MVNKSIPIMNGLRIQFAHFISAFTLYHSFIGSDFIRRIINKIFPIPKGSVIVQTNYGFNMIVDPVVEQGIERSIYVKGTYEAGTISVMKKYLKQGDIFIDVGSNIGLMSLIASQYVGDQGHIYAFEPEPEIFKILMKNIEINNIGNISAYNMALGSSRKKMYLYTYFDVSRAGSSLIKSEKYNSKRKLVWVRTLDEFITTNNIPGIRMIKIDVEGWEYEALQGMQRLLKSSHAPIICIEYSKITSRKGKKLLDVYHYILSVNDYQIFKLQKGKKYPSKLVKIAKGEDLPYHDNLFCFLPKHLE